MVCLVGFVLSENLPLPWQVEDWCRTGPRACPAHKGGADLAHLAPTRRQLPDQAPVSRLSDHWAWLLNLIVVPRTVSGNQTYCNLLTLPPFQRSAAKM